MTSFEELLVGMRIFEVMGYQKQFTMICRRAT